MPTDEGAPGCCAPAVRNLLLHLRGRPLQPFRYLDKGSLATISRAARLIAGNIDPYLRH